MPCKAIVIRHYKWKDRWWVYFHPPGHYPFDVTYEKWSDAIAVAIALVEKYGAIDVFAK